MVGVAILSLIVTLGACGDRVDSGATPGFAPTDRQIDTTPFTMALPDDGTIPEGFFLNPPSESPPPTAPPPLTAPSTTASTTTVPASTTTSQPPYFLPVSVTSICGFTRSIASLFPRDRQPTSNMVARTLEGLTRNLSNYLQVAPPEMRADVNTILALIGELSRLYYEGERDLSYQPLREFTALLVAGEPPYEDIQMVLQRLAYGEGLTCGGLG